jgi:DNA-binding transcriptional LysR family regulator
MRHERLSLDDLELVRAIGAHGSLTGAAKALVLDHSSAFRRLAAVEARVGAALFRRSRRGYTPTDAGELTIASAQRVLAETERLQRELAGRDARTEGRIRITLPDTLAPVAARMCAAFRAEQPGLRCDLVVANAFLTLQQQDADVALRASVLPPEGLSSRKVAAISIAAYAAAGRGGGRGKALDEAALAQGDWVALDESLAHLSSAQWLSDRVPAERIAMRVNTLPAALAACEAGLGRALLPCYLADASPAVRRISAPLPQVRADLWFATHPDLRRSAKVKLLREFALRWLPGEVALE